MPHEELEIIIDNEGNVTLEVRGIKGPGCEALTQPLEEALGDLKERHRKEEYYGGEEDIQTREEHRM